MTNRGVSFSNDSSSSPNVRGGCRFLVTTVCMDSRTPSGARSNRSHRNSSGLTTSRSYGSTEEAGKSFRLAVTISSAFARTAAASTCRSLGSTEPSGRIGRVAQRLQQPTAPTGHDPLRGHVLRNFDIDNMDGVPGLLQVVEQPLGVPLPRESSIDDEVLAVGDGATAAAADHDPGKDGDESTTYRLPVALPSRSPTVHGPRAGSLRATARGSAHAVAGARWWAPAYRRCAGTSGDCSPWHGVHRAEADHPRWRGR